MKTSCINHPAQEKLIIIREWQLEFCNGDACEASLLSFFEYWHNIRLEQTKKAKRANEIAVMHGDEGQAVQDESLLQFHTEKELEENIMIYGRTKISEAIKNLQQKRVIEVYKNPNPRYAFDKTKYFLFHPEVCNDWIKKHYPDLPEMGNRCTKSGSRSTRSGEAITEITTEISINKHTHNNNSDTNSKTSNGDSEKDCVCVSSPASPFPESIVNRLKAWFNQASIDKIILKYPVSYLNEKIDLTLTAKPKNPAGFFSRALKENWKGTSDLVSNQQTEEEPEWAKEQRREYAELLKQEYLDNPDIADWEKKWALDWEEKYGYFPDPEIERILKVGRYANTGRKQLKSVS
ncbi:MAG: hypothetical protein QY317_16670 [Candidatus Jettenia caeni]|nr:MAG: hypothetical protein QY317_16670 [Candidatus Jettenia caeni]